MLPRRSFGKVGAAAAKRAESGVATNRLGGSLGAFDAVKRQQPGFWGDFVESGMKTETLRENAPAKAVRPLRVLHVLDHSWPVHTGYSIRSLHLIAAQYRLGLRPQALTGPLQTVDDPNATETGVENITYRKTPFRGKFSEWAISRRRPGLSETAGVRPIPNRILELLEKYTGDLVHTPFPSLCGLGALQAAPSKSLPLLSEL